MQQAPTIPHNTEPNPQTEPPIIGPKPQKEGWRSIMGTIAILAAAPLIAIALTTLVFQSYVVDGQSMETILQNNDRLIVNKLPRTLDRFGGGPYIPKRGEIVVFHRNSLPIMSSDDDSNDKQLIKRVIALPGERVVVDNNVVTVYNQQRPEGFNPDVEGGYANAAKVTPGNVDIMIGKNQVFLMGDNRTNSLDSRSFGPVPSEDLVGELSFRFYPFNKLGGF